MDIDRKQSGGIYFIGHFNSSKIVRDLQRGVFMESFAEVVQLVKINELTAVGCVKSVTCSY